MNATSSIAWSLVWFCWPCCALPPVVIFAQIFCRKNLRPGVPTRIWSALEMASSMRLSHGLGIMRPVTLRESTESRKIVVVSSSSSNIRSISSLYARPLIFSSAKLCHLYNKCINLFFSFKVMAPIWTSAHTTQFTKPGPEAQTHEVYSWTVKGGGSQLWSLCGCVGSMFFMQITPGWLCW